VGGRKDVRRDNWQQNAVICATEQQPRILMQCLVDCIRDGILFKEDQSKYSKKKKNGERNAGTIHKKKAIAFGEKNLFWLPAQKCIVHPLRNSPLIK
jgi:hypothetical protein